MRFIAVLCCSNIATANRYPGILACQLNTAAAYSGDIHRTCNSNRGGITGHQNTGSIDALTTFSNTLDIADCQRTVNINLTHLALNINTGCSITLRSNVRDFYCSGNIQMRAAISVNAMSASGIRIIGCNCQLLVSRIINNLDISIGTCVNSCCLSAGLCNIQSQSLAGHIYSHRFGRRC